MNKINNVKKIIDDINKTVEEISDKMDILSDKRNNKQQFINEVVSLMQKYNLSISHEDTHGAFIIKGYDENTIEWFKQAILKEN